MAKGIITSKFLKRTGTAVGGANKVSKFKRTTSLLPKAGKRIKVKPTGKKGIVSNVIDLVVSASKGDLNLNALGKTASVCCTSLFK